MTKSLVSALLAGVIAIGATPTAHAQTKNPGYKEARAVYEQLKQPFFDTGMFYKKPFNERLSYMNAAKTLRDRAEKLFGVPSQCFSAASMRYEYVTKLHDFMNRLEGRVNSQVNWNALTDPMYLAFIYGESTAACYSDVEKLDRKK